ncbi:MAG: ATPase [Treponema sp.]|nr:MAG: ATPase [Treponema sp.]
MNSSDFFSLVKSFRSEMAKKIVGQEALLDNILMSYIAGGHVLLEGVPGLAKTLMVKTFATLTNGTFKRIQFTPDLLPADLIGTLIYQQAQGKFAVRKGPVFANIILADEINRASAKVQSALLEAMAEGQVTIGENSYQLPKPFFVLATQNPIEQEGTYPLPEAELDRFLLKLFVPYPHIDNEVEIVNRLAVFQSDNRSEDESEISECITDNLLLQMRDFCNNVRCDEMLTKYMVSLVAATRPSHKIKQDEFSQGTYLSYISFGASPRASIALKLCAKIEAAFNGRDYVIPDDVKKIAYPVLRHRIKLSYEAGAENLSTDDIIEKLLSVVPQP